MCGRALHEHPYQQLATGLLPDQHTAKVCFHVLKAALADVAGGRESAFAD